MKNEDIYQTIMEMYKQKTGKELSKNEFADKVSDLIIKLESGDIRLEDKLSEMSDDELITEVTSEPIYLHELFGKVGESSNKDYQSWGFSGDISLYPYLGHKPYVYYKGTEEAKKIRENFKKRHSTIYDFLWDTDIWKGNKIPNTFEARIFGFNLSNGDYMFQMWYSDTTHTDDLLGTARYMLMLPKDKKSKIVPKIREKPELLVNIFKTMFTEFDNSKGKLKIDPNFTPRIEKAEEKQ